MSNLCIDWRKIQPDIVVGINLPNSEYLQMSTGVVIFDKFSSTEGQYSRGQMREAEQLWRRIVCWVDLLSTMNSSPFFLSTQTTHIWRLLWKLCMDWLISFHSLRSGCSLKLTDWLGDTLRCCHCLDLCKKAALNVLFEPSCREVINIYFNCSSSNPIRAAISISQGQTDESWSGPDMRQLGFSALPQLSWFKKMAATSSVFLFLIPF